MIEWYYLVLISSVLMAAATILEKRTLKSEHATQYSAAFSWIIAIVSLVFLPLANISQISPLQWLLLVVGSVLTSASYLISARVFKHGSLSVATPVSSSLPLFFIVLFAYTYLSERLSLIQYGAIAGLIVATYILLFNRPKSGKKKDFESTKYKYFLVISAILTAVTTIIGRYQLLDIGVFSFLVIMQILMAFEFAIFITLKYNGIREIAQTAITYRYTLIAIVLLTIAYRLTYYNVLSLPLVSVSIASTVRNSLFVVITVFFAGSMFKEQGIKRKMLLGIIMVLLSYVLIA
ncbi:MAG: EamA family transporter [Candidatus Micrarchaeota archaeon]|nr:EamA family transporter [Candidatus Micrarchaeota archaeon]